MIHRASDIVIVGSGPAGTAAALACADCGIVPTVIDVGLQPSRFPPTIPFNFYEYARQEPVFDLLIGRDYSGLYNLNPANPHVSFLLTMPKYAYVRTLGQDLGPLEQDGVSFVQSFTRGGLANAWGCAAYRYLDDDLTGWPICAADLAPYYDRITEEIGINGAQDDLADLLGPTTHLLPPMSLAANSRRILENYQENKAFFKKHGVILGRMRSAVLTCDHKGRRAHPLLNTDTVAQLDAFYSPVYTLDRLIKSNQIDYRSGLLVERFYSECDRVYVVARDISSGHSVEISCRYLLLGAGTINTARIVLRSYGDYSTELPVYDNPAVYVPSLLFDRVGKALDIHGYGFASLAIFYKKLGYSPYVQGMVFETQTVPRAEFCRHFPFSARSNLALARYLLPALVVVILYFPSSALPPAKLRLKPDGTLLIKGPKEDLPDKPIHKAIQLNRKLGLWSSKSLVEKAVYGGSIHYVGCLPMVDVPRSRYQTDSFGRLAADKRVHVIDGACLPNVSAKNHTLTIMANAMRIATAICQQEL